MTVEGEEGRARRRIRRRGASMSDSTVAEGGSVAGLNDDVEGRAAPSTTTRLSENESHVGSKTDAPQDFTPYNRMKEVGKASQATTYEREYRLKLLHRMLMRNVPLDQIALELDISVSTVIRDRKELNRRLREAAQDLNVNELIGDTMGFYQEVQGMGLRAASASKAPLNMRLAAMRTALASKNDMHRFLGNVGVYDVLRYRAGDTDAGSDIEKLVSITEAILGGNDEDDPLQSIADLPFMDEDEEEIRII